MPPSPPPAKAFCKRCDYVLHGIPAGPCPECGTPFDLLDPSSFSRQPPSRFRRLNAEHDVAGWCVVSYAAVWWTHLLLTQLNDPLGPLADAVLWPLACVLKVACLLAVGAVLTRVYRAAQGSSRAGLVACGVWAGTGMSVVLLLAALREPLGVLLHTDAARYFTPSTVAESAIGSEAWLARWRGGQVVLIELMLVLALAATHALIAVKVGGAPGTATFVALVATVALLVSHSFAFGLVVLDYDIFHGDIFSGGLLFDLLIPIVAADPYATVGTLVYVPVWAASIVVLRLLDERQRGGRRAPAPFIVTPKGT